MYKHVKIFKAALIVAATLGVLQWIPNGGTHVTV